MYNIVLTNTDHKALFAITKERNVIDISNQILRTLQTEAFQDVMYHNSICIVCNYKFRDRHRGWSKNIKAFCHPFKDTSNFPEDTRLYILSESDFVDELWVPVEAGDYKKRYDFIYFTLNTMQGIRSKGFFALPAIMQAAAQLKLKGLVVDYLAGSPGKRRKKQLFKRGSKDPWIIDTRRTRKRIDRLKDQCDVKFIDGWQDPEEVCRLTKQSKFVLFPNTRDASPRLITESLIRGVPIMVSDQIYGGWKYVTKNNGKIFNGPLGRSDYDHDRDKVIANIRIIMQEILSTSYDPKSIKREYYEQYGLFNSAKILANIINDIEGHDKYLYVMYKEFQHVFVEHMQKKD